MKPVLTQTFLAALALAAAGAAAAAPATDEGAARVTAALQAYLGTTPGVVTVTPNGEVYDLTISIAPLVAGIKDATASLSPQHLTLTDQGGGLWGVTQNEGFDFRLEVPGALTVEASAASVAMTGTFDESLKSFRDWTGELTSMTVAETITEAPGVAAVDVRYTIDTAQSAFAGKPGLSGGIDGTMTGTAQGLREELMMPGPDGSAMPVTVTIDSLSQTADMKGMRAAPILELVAWFVAHPSEEAIKSAQDDLRKAVGAALPLFDRMTGKATYEGMSVETPMGQFGAMRAALTIDANGLVADGRVREAVEIEGLTLPPGVVPDWAAPLIPSFASFDFEGSGFNLADPAQMIVAAFDLAAEPPLPEAMVGPLLSALLPAGAFDLRLAPSEIRSDIYALTYEGAMTVPTGEGALPTGQGKVTMTGMEAVLEALNKAPPEVSQQAGPVLAMARGIAKVGAPGEYVWAIDATEPGKVKVNDLDLSALGAP